MEPSDVIRAVERFSEACNRQDIEAVKSFLTDDCVFENTNPPPDGRRYEGLNSVAGFWAEFFEKNPGATFTVEEVIVAGNRCVVRWVYNKAKDGNPWHLRGIDLFTIRDGKVAEKLSYVKG